jgi:hypothetical protein
MIEKIFGRIVRMIKFDTTVYKEIEDDQNANTEAAIVVLAASVLSAVGSGIAARSFGAFVLNFVVGALLNWLLWSYVTMFVGTRLFKGETNFWEMARCVGYANFPAALGIFGAIPCINVLAGIVALILTLVVGFFAVREALDLPTERTLLTIVIGWAIVFLIRMVLVTIF